MSRLSAPITSEFSVDGYRRDSLTNSFGGVFGYYGLKHERPHRSITTILGFYLSVGCPSHFAVRCFEPGFPISPWYRTHRINRRVLSLQGSDARSRTTEGDTWWVKKKTVRFSSHSTAC